MASNLITFHGHEILWGNLIGLGTPCVSAKELAYRIAAAEQSISREAFDELFEATCARIVERADSDFHAAWASPSETVAYLLARGSSIAKNAANMRNESRKYMTKHVELRGRFEGSDTPTMIELYANIDAWPNCMQPEGLGLFI
jgi:hypothetical protein